MANTLSTSTSTQSVLDDKTQDACTVGVVYDFHANSMCIGAIVDEQLTAVGCNAETGCTDNCTLFTGYGPVGNNLS